LQRNRELGISTKYRGSFNTLAFGEIKPYSGSLKDDRLDLVYYRIPALTAGISSRFGLFTSESEKTVSRGIENAKHKTPPAKSHAPRNYPEVDP
jgi:hypothetical protein